MVLGRPEIVDCCDTCLDEDSAKVGITGDTPVQSSTRSGEGAGQIFSPSVSAEELCSTRQRCLDKVRAQVIPAGHSN